ncbi:MAG: DUF4845 domain-containing protein [Amphritea sp.]
MTLRKTQVGASFFSTMIVLIVAGIFFTVGFKLYPAYWDHYLLKSVVTELAERPDEASLPAAEVKMLLNKRFRINQVRLPNKNALTIERDEGIITITLNYDVQVPMFSNVDALIKFDEQFEVISR